jgi:hypothetical protein
VEHQEGNTPGAVSVMNQGLVRAMDSDQQPVFVILQHDGFTK